MDAADIVNSVPWVPHPGPDLTRVGVLPAVWVLSAAPLLWALAVTLAFAAVAYLLRGVTRSGAVAGAVVAFVLLYFGGPGVFAVLVVLFIITSLSTRLGYRRKQRLGVAEGRHGRNAGQVLANLSIAAISVLVSHICLVLADVGRVPRLSPWVAHPSPVLARVGIDGIVLIACIAALSEAAADTVSSECGEAWSDAAYLVTGFRRVPPGTNGAISVPGTLAGAVAAGLIAATAAAMRILTAQPAAIAGVAGFVGSLLDSLLGATLERRGLLGNNAVNFLSTAAAAILAAAIAGFAIE